MFNDGWIWVMMSFHSHGATQAHWMVYFMEKSSKMDDLEVSPIFKGNSHMGKVQKGYPLVI